MNSLHRDRSTRGAAGAGATCRDRDDSQPAHPLDKTSESRITLRDTIVAMAQAISVRLDDEAQKALRSLEAAGLSRSEAIRSALIASADRLRRRSVLAAEVAALEADEADRGEMLAVARLMESLRAQG